MATDLAEKTDIDAADLPADGELPDGQEASSSPGVLQLSRQKVKVIVLLLVVMGVQMAVGYVLLPEPAVTSMETANESADAMGDDPAEGAIDTVEVSLGNYNPTNSLGVGIVHVAFDLTAIAAAENAQALKVAFLETHGARIRSAVIRVIRSSNLEDLNDPESYVIKRKIREEINKVLPKTLIIEVVMDQFRLMPQ